MQITWKGITVVQTEHQAYITLLSNVSGCVESGQVYFITGSSSSGKSSLLRLLAGRISSSRGNVIQGQLFEDGLPRNVSKASLRAVLVDVNDINLLPELSLIQNMQILDACNGLQSRGDSKSILISLGLYHDADKHMVYDRKMGLTFHGSRMPVPTLEHRLICLALALASSSDAILLDNFFVGLDASDKEHLARVLQGLARAKSKLLVCTAPEEDTDLAIGYQFGIFVLRDGECTETSNSISTITNSFPNDPENSSHVIVGCSAIHEGKSGVSGLHTEEVIVPKHLTGITSAPRVFLLLKADLISALVSGSIMMMMTLLICAYYRTTKTSGSHEFVYNDIVAYMQMALALTSTQMTRSTWGDRLAFYTSQAPNLAITKTTILLYHVFSIGVSGSLRALPISITFHALTTSHKSLSGFLTCFASISLILLISELFGLAFLCGTNKMSKTRTLSALLTMICALLSGQSGQKEESTARWLKVRLASYLYHGRLLQIYAEGQARSSQASFVQYGDVKSAYLGIGIILLISCTLICVFLRNIPARSVSSPVCLAAPLLTADSTAKVETMSGPRIAESLRNGVDVIVVGAGSGGLVAAAKCKARGLSCIVLEKGDKVGQQWLTHYPWAAMSTPKGTISVCKSNPLSLISIEYVALPGCELPAGIGPSFTYQEYAEYLQRYSDTQRLNVQFGAEVMRAEWTSKDESQNWIVQLKDGDLLTSRHLIICTGILSEPYIPQIPGIQRFTGNQYHSDKLESHSVFTGRTVLVVGAGMAALQVGKILTSLPGTNVVYAFRRMPALLPSKAWGISIFWMANEFSWLDSRLMDLVQNLVARLYYGWNYPSLFPKLTKWHFGKDNRIPTIDPDGLLVAALKAGRASVVSGPKSIWEDGFVDCDGSVYQCQDIVWATGYTKARPPFIREEFHDKAQWIGWSKHHSIPIAVSVEEAEVIVAEIAKNMNSE